MASISEQTTDPTRYRYKVRWRDPRTRQARSWGTNSHDAAKRKKRDVETAIDKGTYHDDRLGKVTVAEWADMAAPDWIDLKASTRDRYLEVLATQIKPSAVGRMRLCDVTTDDVRKLVAKWTRSGLSAATTRKAYYVLRRLFADAVPERIAVSPCEGVRLPRAESKVPDTLTRAEIDKLADACEDDHYRAWFYVCGVAGLRIGESLALRWADLRLDDDRPSIRVRGGVSESGGQVRIETPKTRAGVRSVPITEAVAAELRALREWREDPGGRDLVFPAPEGGLYRPGNFRNRVFNPACERVGFNITPHALRHSALTAWLEAGATPMLAAAWAGHADKGALIVRTYGHVNTAHADHVLDALNDD